MKGENGRHYILITRLRSLWQVECYEAAWFDNWQQVGQQRPRILQVQSHLYVMRERGGRGEG